MGLYQYGEKIAGPGKTGKSAFDYARENGYTGSEYKFGEFMGNVEYMQYYCMNEIFKLGPITLTQADFNDGVYTLPHERINKDSIVTVYYSAESMDIRTEMGGYEESVDGGLKIVLNEPTNSFTIVIEAIKVENLNYDPTAPIFTIDEGQITNNTTITTEGYAIDARQLNQNVEGSFAKTVMELIEALRQENANLKERLDLLTSGAM